MQQQDGAFLTLLFIYLAQCQDYIRASFSFTMTPDSATQPEDVTCVISEK